MTLRFRPTATALALAVGLAGFATITQAWAQSDATQDRQQTVADLTAAQAALAHGRIMAATEATGRAETVLLNAQQAGAVQDEHALQAVQRAHRALLQKNRQDAASALRDASTALGATQG